MLSMAGYGAFIVIKTTKHGVGGIIDVSHEYADGTTAFKPVMMGAVDLHQFAIMGSRLTPLPVLPGFALLVGDLRLVQP